MERKKEIIVLCGASHSGKSDYVQEYHVTHTIISSDKIRAELGVKYGEAEDKVWHVFAARKFEAMQRLDNIILDACHLSVKARRKALRDVNGDYRKIAVVFNPPWWKLVGRCIREKRMDLRTVRAIWEKWNSNKPAKKKLLRAGFDEVKEVK